MGAWHTKNYQQLLPEPTITVLDGGILVTLLKDKYSTLQIKPLGLSEIQITYIKFVKENKKITSKDYQLLMGLSRETSSRDLKKLVDIGIFKDTGLKGAGAFYELN